MSDFRRRYAFESEAALDDALNAIEAGFSTLRERGSMSWLTYYDTFDWRLYQSGGTLGETSSGGGTRLLLWADLDGQVRLRIPVDTSPEFASSLPEGPLRDALAPKIEIRRLLPIVRVASQVDEIRLLDERGMTAVTLEVARATALPPEGPGPEQMLPIVLSLTPEKGARPIAEALVQLIEDEHKVPPDPLSPLDHALAAIGRRSKDYTSKITVPLSPGMRSDVALRLVLHALLDNIATNAPGVRAEIDTEFLHDFRVAIRRSRSALGQVQGVFPANTTAHFRDELAWLGEVSTALRDLDVYLLMMPDFRAELPAEISAVLDPLHDFLEQQQHIEQSRLVAAMDSERFGAFLGDWRGFLEQAPEDPAPPDAPNAARPVESLANECIWRAFRRVQKRGRAIKPSSPAADLHELRIACKKLRYLIEIFHSLYPAKEGQAVIAEMKRLQDNLGLFNDAAVQHAALDRYAQQMYEARVGTAATYMAIGRLVEHLEQAQARQRRLFHARWKRFASAENRERFKRLFEPRPEDRETEAGVAAAGTERAAEAAAEA